MKSILKPIAAVVKIYPTIKPLYRRFSKPVNQAGDGCLNLYKDYQKESSKVKLKRNEHSLINNINQFCGYLLVVISYRFVFLVGWILILWFKWKDREKRSLKQVNLLVVVPEDNEVKIDAMESILSSFSSMYKTAKPKFLQFLVGQPSASLEIVGTNEDIKFYVSVPNQYRDMIEKQIYSVYAGADIKEVQEPNVILKMGWWNMPG
jgi:hypothetical protein